MAEAGSGGAQGDRLARLRTFATGRVGDEPASPDDAFARRLREVPVRVYEAPTPDQRPETRWAAFKLELGPSISNCLEGIGTGEGDLLSQQTACDIFAGLIPGTNAIFAFRDLYFAGMNFVDGKQTASDYIKGTFALVNLAVSAVPAVRSIGNTFSKARLALKGKSAELLIAREAAAKVRRVVDDPTEAAAESALVKILAEGDDEARQGLLYLLDDALAGADRVQTASAPAAPVTSTRMRTAGAPQATVVTAVSSTSAIGGETIQALFGFLDNLENNVAKGKASAFVKSLKKAAAKDPALGPQIAARMVSQLGHLARALGGHTLSLSDEAVEGLALFMKHTKSERRLEKMWQELVDPEVRGSVGGGGPGGDGALLLEREEAERQAGRHGWQAGQPSGEVLERWFHNLLARGAGTSRTFRSTSGAYHALRACLAQFEKYPGAAIQALDSGLDGFSGRPDLVLKIDDWVWQFEFKRLTRLLAGREISQLHAIAEAAYERIVTDARFSTRALQRTRSRRPFKRLVYEFPTDAKALESGLDEPTTHAGGERAPRLGEGRRARKSW